jgi:hypothetical protein
MMPAGSAYVSPIWTRVPSGCVAAVRKAGIFAIRWRMTSGTLSPHASSVRIALFHRRYWKSS